MTESPRIESADGSGVGDPSSHPRPSPLAPRSSAAATAEQFLIASQWRLMWWKFRKHRVAVASLVILMFFYAVAIFCEFISPANPRQRHAEYVFAPRHKIHFFDAHGHVHLWPFVYRMPKGIIDESLSRHYALLRVPLGAEDDDDGFDDRLVLEKLRHAFASHDIHLSENATVQVQDSGYRWRIFDRDRAFAVENVGDAINVYDRSTKQSLRLFVGGDEYRMWGLFPMRAHLFGLEDGRPLFLLGADHLGRDLLSRIFYGSRISLSIGLVGVLLSLVIGCVVGGISGYFGGWVDNVIQRFIETLLSLPTIPLWMGLSAAFPPTWPPLRIYFGIVVILSLLGWTGLARVIRGKVISLREEDFAMAARLSGATEWWTIRKHMLPSFFSYIVVSTTLAVPAMILGETTLSYLGIGLREPVVSWGVLLQQAQNIQVVSEYPWIMTPAIFVIAAVLAFNFVGDGLRDAADPYST